MFYHKHSIRNRNFLFTIWCGTAVFLTYFCMYMYRKPFTANTYSEMTIWGVDYKIILVISQVLGYAFSKFIGIKLISELNPTKRVSLIFFLITLAWLPLVGLAYLPFEYGPFLLFINGLPLGLIWGVVFTYCEGRKFTEVLTVILSANFIITSGIAKSIGKWVVQMEIPPNQMPMIVGLCTFPLLFISLWMLSQLPAPSISDIALKVERKPMNNNDRRVFLKNYGFVIFSFVVGYLILTVLRDIRDNFAVEIWTDIGLGDQPDIYTSTELPVMLIVLLSIGFLYRIKNNYKALLIDLWICVLGMIGLVIVSTLFYFNFINPVLWMILIGIFLFVPYILMNGIIFDRFIASFLIVGNVGFIMYIADSVGYLGSIMAMIFKNFGKTNLPWLDFFTILCIAGGLFGAIIYVLVILRLIKKKGIILTGLNKNNQA